MDRYILAVLLTIVLLDVGITTITAIPAGTTTIGQLAYGKAFLPSNFATERQAPIATSDDSLYIAWWTNKTGNDEVIVNHKMYKLLLQGVMSMLHGGKEIRQ